jgi:hypothetical protein
MNDSRDNIPGGGRVLVAGWFSFEQMGASAGDLIARDLTCRWLERAGRAYDVAVAPPFTGGVDWRAVDPGRYADVLFVCGPFGNGPPLAEFLDRFRGRRLVGLDLTMLQRLDEWNPFDRLWERDSDRAARPDVCFGAETPKVPVVGLVLIDAQPEYKGGDLRLRADGAIARLVASREMSVVRIDTRLDENATGLRTAAEVESLVARMDAVVTTRLHGTVLAIKNGVPAVVIDAVAGGHKVRRQAEAIGWPVAFGVEDLTDERLRQAFDYCLTDDARAKARECARRAAATVVGVGDEFVAAMSAAAAAAATRPQP